ncbi:MAG: peptidoglycan DD-metalloendopeptidase family protein [Neisseria sp.]|nr:peptidoglycan DD-metalloendopeptidase family protein [Neisseria sp.]
MKKSLFSLWTSIFLCLLLTACAGSQTPPVVDHSPPPPGFYRVQRGDNLYRIGLKYNQSVTTLARLNNLSDVNQLEVGQLLRVVPTPGTASASKPKTTTTRSTTPPVTSSSAALKNLNLVWPAAGRVLANYDGSSNKGINIGGAHGSAVQAAAGGEVVYASDQLRGYGKMVLIRHNKQVLTAYAYNDRILVSVGQKVKQGETIAHMGNAADGRSMLHFELRVNGNAVNPMPHLPAR